MCRVSVFFSYMVYSQVSVSDMLQKARVMVVRVSVYLNGGAEARVFSKEELWDHRGVDPELPLLLGFNCSVYDVTTGTGFYGIGNGYNVFAGRDATRAFSTGCFVEGSILCILLRNFNRLFASRCSWS